MAVCAQSRARMSTPISPPPAKGACSAWAVCVFIAVPDQPRQGKTRLLMEQDEASGRVRALSLCCVTVSFLPLLWEVTPTVAVGYTGRHAAASWFGFGNGGHSNGAQERPRSGDHRADRLSPPAPDTACVSPTEWRQAPYRYVPSSNCSSITAHFFGYASRDSGASDAAVTVDAKTGSALSSGFTQAAPVGWAQTCELQLSEPKVSSATPLRFERIIRGYWCCGCSTGAYLTSAKPP